MLATKTENSIKIQAFSALTDTIEKLDYT